MKTLVIIRHAKSCWKDPQLDDFNRPLNGRGKRDIPVMAEKLVSKGLKPDGIVSSPAKRARKTARGMAKSMGFKKSLVRLDDRLYPGSIDQLMKVASGFPETWETAFLVGHNEAISELARCLTCSKEIQLPPLGIAATTFDVISWVALGSVPGQLLFVDFPKGKSE